MSARRETARRLFDSNWFWAGIAYFGLAAVAIWLYTVSINSSRTSARTASDEAIRIAEQHATAQATYKACLKGRPIIHKINVHFDGVKQLAETLVVNARANLRFVTPGTALYTTRVRLLLRLEQAEHKIVVVPRLPETSAQQCLAAYRRALRR